MLRKFKVIEHPIYTDNHTRPYVGQEVEEVSVILDDELIVCRSSDGKENDFMIEELEEIL